MPRTPKDFFLNYGISGLAVIVIVIQLFFVNKRSLNKWKGGGYGMYTGIHYYFDQIHITGFSVDSLLKKSDEIKPTFSRLMVMPNDENLKSTAEIVLKVTKEDSIHIQVWKPTINSRNGFYSRVMINEIHLKRPQL